MQQTRCTNQTNWVSDW